mmetsp:Transcript_365/g.1080  ORF Transcript_365/g.1080 Transcript_365/m.1080 type:complete len:440 (-) Transcript_365:2117-3436(-)
MSAARTPASCGEFNDDLDRRRRRIRALPKIELHAHLNGSLRLATLFELHAALQPASTSSQSSGACSPLLGSSSCRTLTPPRQSSSPGRERAAQSSSSSSASPTILGVVSAESFTIPTLDHCLSMQECFALFPMIHAVTTSVDVIRRIAREVIEDFAAENTRYLELRTTPRACLESGMTKRSYLEAVITELQRCNADPSLRIQTRLLVSVNRAQSEADAHENVALAIEFRDRFPAVARNALEPLTCVTKPVNPTCSSESETKRTKPSASDSSIVVGVDLSGNPTAPVCPGHLDALRRARRAGLPLTVHVAEVSTQADTEQLVALQPGRLGHATFLSDCQASHRAVLETPIPLEVCLTSNLKSKTVANLQDHHVVEYLKAKHPLSLCTDDMGVFQTSLTEELSLAHFELGLSIADLATMQRAAIEFSFADEQTKAALRSQM